MDYFLYVKNNPIVLFSILFIVLAVIGGAYKIFANREETLSERRELIIGDNKVLVEISDTLSLRAKGLSGRDSLGNSEGMLFIFQLSAKYTFWMKGMKIPLDVVWIRDSKVVGITENVPYPKRGEAPTKMSPQESVNWVLELNAGEVKGLGIEVGDEVELVL